MRDRSSEKGASLIIFALLLSMVMLPMLGLCIDVSFIYFAKVRLYSAVDAAALAGGRSLKCGARFFEPESECGERGPAVFSR